MAANDRYTRPIAGMSKIVVPLVPLMRSLEAWLALPNPLRWLIRTIRPSNVIQFARRLPRFNAILFTSVAGIQCQSCTKTHEQKD